VPARGDVILARFPFTDGSGAKLRPVLVLARVPGVYEDYLALFVSSQVHLAVPDVDVIIGPGDPGFADAGLKVPSVFRVGKLATISSALILGPLGSVGEPLLSVIVRHLTRLLEGPKRARSRS
jgi:mRNA interferase MazF